MVGTLMRVTLHLLTVGLRLAKEDGAGSGVVRRVWLQGQVWGSTECMEKLEPGQSGTYFSLMLSDELKAVARRTQTDEWSV